MGVYLAYESKYDIAISNYVIIYMEDFIVSFVVSGPVLSFY